MENFLYQDLSHKIIGICFEIYNEYGWVHKEVVYHRLLKEKFDKHGIPYIYEPKIDVFSQETGKIMGCYIPDFLIDHKIILEIKAVPINSYRDFQQLCTYLKVSQYEIGYLINFGLNTLIFKRSIFTNNRKKINTAILD